MLEVALVPEGPLEAEDAFNFFPYVYFCIFHTHTYIYIYIHVIIHNYVHVSMNSIYIYIYITQLYN